MKNDTLLPALREQLVEAAAQSQLAANPRLRFRLPGLHRPVTRRGTVTALAIVLGLGGAATGAAAAAGVFDSQANTVLKTMASSLNRTDLLQFHDGAKFSAAIDPSKEILVGTESGPEGTTLSIVTYLANPSFGCVAVVDSAGPGRRLDPSKPPPGNAGGCGTRDFNLGNLPTPGIAPDEGTYAGGGSIWISPTTGKTYWIDWGRVISSATKVRFTYPDGTDISVPVLGGWWADAVSTATASNSISAPDTPYVETIYGANDQVLFRNLSK